MLWDQYKTANNDRTVEPGPGGWWYHHAPTTDRARIQQHGLMPSVPNRNDAWGQIDPQPEGVYFMGSPTAAEPMMRQRPLEHQQPMDVWRVPSEGLQVHTDPIVWEKSVYSPNAVTNPELFRPYEKSNDFARQFERHELPGIAGTSGPVPEDWVNYHDYHELGNPSDEEWQSYGIGQPTETWRQAGFNGLHQPEPRSEWEKMPRDLYHAAPTSERDRILQHGLQASNPTYNWTDYVSPEQWQKSFGQLPTTGVYGFDSPIRAKQYATESLERFRQEPHDIWRIPFNRIQEAHPDIDIHDAWVIPHSVDPQLWSGTEHDDWRWPQEPSTKPEDIWRYENRDLYLGPGQSLPSQWGIGWGGRRPWAQPQPFEVAASLHQAKAPGMQMLAPKEPDATTSKVADLYHVSPTIERNRIKTWGLQPANPYYDNGVGPEGWEEAYGPDFIPPTGVYGFPSPEQAREWGIRPWSEPLDIWRFPGEGEPDPDTEGAFYVPHAVEPTLHEGPEHRMAGTFGHVTANQVMYHVSPVRYRTNNEQWGIPMSQGLGAWEDGVYLHGNLDQALKDQHYRQNVAEVPEDEARLEPHDVWEVNVGGLPVERDPQGDSFYNDSWLHRDDIPPERIQRIAGRHRAETYPKPWEAKMWHGKPSSRGLMGPVRCPFWSTSAQEEAHGMAGDGGSVHPVSIRFHNPAHFFANANWGPESLELARQSGHDGAVVHWPGQIDDPANPQPPRKWAIALDPGAVVPGHLQDSYDSGV